MTLARILPSSSSINFSAQPGFLSFCARTKTILARNRCPPSRRKGRRTTRRVVGGVKVTITSITRLTAPRSNWSPEHSAWSSLAKSRYKVGLRRHQIFATATASSLVYRARSQTSFISLRPLSVAIVEAGAVRCGLVVDRFLTEVEVLVKPLAAGLDQCRVFQGAAIMGDGRVVLVLNALECHNLNYSKM